MNTTQVRETLAVAIAEQRKVVVTLRSGVALFAIPAGSGTPRFFKIGTEVVHQYDIVNVEVR